MKKEKSMINQTSYACESESDKERVILDRKQISKVKQKISKKFQRETLYTNITGHVHTSFTPNSMY